MNNKIPDSWPAPAKLNLFLHITGRRDDGYHDLQTLFQFLDYGDELSFRVRKDGRILRVTTVENVAAEQDLTVRAATLLQQHGACKLGAEIAIKKRLPQGGGLGGGSSDAATTLVALNELWNLRLPQQELLELGRQLGADVPVFIFGKSAWAEGIGEQLQAVELPQPWFVVIFPGLKVPTGELFADPELTRDARPIKIRDYFTGGPFNVFEAIVKRRFPAVNNALEWLSNHAANALHSPMLTGTGSCVFLPLADEVTATGIANEARQALPDDWQVICAKACNVSPLLHRLEGIKH